jgi:hypothetical protein
MREVSLSGNVVPPGFIDSHVHFLDGGLLVMATNCCTPIGAVCKLFSQHANFITGTEPLPSHPRNSWQRRLCREPNKKLSAKRLLCQEPHKKLSANKKYSTIFLKKNTFLASNFLYAQHTLEPSARSHVVFRRHYPHVKDKGTCRMNSGLLSRS